MIKRCFDFFISGALLIVAGPIILFFALLVWMQDGRGPFYFAKRVAMGGGDFLMVKLRSMVVNADATGVSSTAKNDARITGVGKLIRKFKLDELTQLWNVLMGDMSLVGPRPNTRAWGVNLYTPDEMRLLSVRPGITDFASIVFSDEGEVLTGHPEPDIAYNELIRPWKSKLGLFYIDHRSLVLDVQLIILTTVGIVSRPQALNGVARILRALGAPAELIRIAQRTDPLAPTSPPGTDRIVTSRPASSCGSLSPP